MRVTIKTFSHDDPPVIVDAAAHAEVGTLVFSYCTQKEMPYNAKLTIFDNQWKPVPMNQTMRSAGINSGETLYIGQKRSEEVLSAKWPLYVAILALLIGVIGILTMSLVYTLHGGIVPFDYGVVMDAGSSKTNTILYQWLGSKYRNTGCVKQVDFCRVKGGIAKGNFTEKLPKILECANNVTKSIDVSKKIPNTPLYFAATAGMRLLNLSDPDKVTDIMNQLQSGLNDSGLAVKDISIISGEDEGIYAWITTNYLKKTLDVKNTNPFSPVTYGALDMGGASTQIAFAVPPSEENKKNRFVKKMSLYGEDHDVFAKSYLCFGRDEAARRYQALLISSPEVTRVKDACAPEGYKQNLNADAVLNQPCTQTDKFKKWFKDNPELKKHIYTFEGASDYEECGNNIVKLMDNDDCSQVGFKECFSKLPRQLENQKLLAFATYYYTTNYLNVTKSSLEEYMDATKSFCEKTYDQIPDQNDYSAQYCFNARYIYEVLVNGFGFNDTTWKNLEFVDKLDNKEVGWSLGYMINATNVISIKKPSPKLIHPTVLTIFLVIFIILVAATMVYLFQTVCHQKPDEGTVRYSA